jgi:hypothetical protein
VLVELRDTERAQQTTTTGEPSATEPVTPLHERLVKYQEIVDRADWAMSFTHTEDRARVEAFHADGAALMVTIARSRKGVRAYMLTPASAWWRQIPLSAVEAFVARLEIPLEIARRPPVGSACVCKKEKYPTRDRAVATVTDITIKRVIKRHGTQVERRAYRCPSDDRTWHITSRR